MEHHHLLDLEREARRAGSGLNVSDLLGHWQLQTVWPKGRTESNALSGWLLRSLGACLEISADSDGVLQLRNAVTLGSLMLQFSGPGKLKGRQPLLMFRFDQVALTLGPLTLLARSLPAPEAGREPFFALISRNPEGWMAARGRGGGLAYWTLRDSVGTHATCPQASSNGADGDGA